MNVKPSVRIGKLALFVLIAVCCHPSLSTLAAAAVVYCLMRFAPLLTIILFSIYLVTQINQ